MKTTNFKHNSKDAYLKAIKSAKDKKTRDSLFDELEEFTSFVRQQQVNRANALAQQETEAKVDEAVARQEGNFLQALQLVIDAFQSQTHLSFDDAVIDTKALTDAFLNQMNDRSSPTRKALRDNYVTQQTAFLEKEQWSQGKRYLSQ